MFSCCAISLNAFKNVALLFVWLLEKVYWFQLFENKLNFYLVTGNTEISETHESHISNL